MRIYNFRQGVAAAVPYILVVNGVRKRYNKLRNFFETDNMHIT